MQGRKSLLTLLVTAVIGIAACAAGQPNVLLIMFIADVASVPM